MTSARRLALVCSALLVTATGCTTSSSSTGTSQESSSSAAPCKGQAIDLVKDDRLTIATYDPVFAPWFVSNDPGNGQGFESALGFQAAKKMGFDPHRVKWIRLPFEDIAKPSGKTFDLALAEVSITRERAKQVDFSTPYASTRQAVLSTGDGPLAKARTVSDMRTATLGASVQTTSLAAIGKVLKPATKATSFPTIAAATQALNNKKVDGVVVDVPTAEYLAGTQLKDGRLIGTLPGTDEQLGAVLPKGSKLTPCLNRALATLSSDGTISDLKKEWLPRRGKIEELPQGSPSTSAKPSPKSTSAPKPSAKSSSKPD
ncbi:ABC transporter substrate-binding protein [Demetria terragena]|uniref:ABC transporter substrate-binding protein n=1 Tax=Demetria terragena TaxID=63959 RepID=UPI000375A09C|nr:ABC transporter substrate-binding protein [Demetria terragena]